MNLKETYNKIAVDWDKDHQSDDWWVKGTDKFCLLLPHGTSILDVGCGAGTATKYLLSKGFKVSGIDFSEKLLEIAKQKNPSGTFSLVDIYDLDTIKESFGGVFVKAVLLHIPKKDIGAIFERLARKVKADGYLYVSVKEQRPDGIEEEIKEENDYGYAYKRFFSYFLPEEIEAYFKQVGFEVVYNFRQQIIGKTVWVQVIGKKLNEKR